MTLFWDPPYGGVAPLLVTLHWWRSTDPSINGDLSVPVEITTAQIFLPCEALVWVVHAYATDATGVRSYPSNEVVITVTPP